MKLIIVNEWRGLLRNRIFLLLALVFSICLGLSTWLSVVQNEAQREAQTHAKDHVRAQWDEMGPSNPHRAAHYGSYAFKPTTALNSIDEGINSVTGNVLRLEGHKQNDVLFSEASQSLLISKFGKLKPSLMFQFIIPLILIFLSFNAYSAERDSGRLKLLLIQGAGLTKIVFAKVFGIWAIGLALLLLTTLVQVFVNPGGMDSDTQLRLLSLILGYGLYYLIVINLTVAFSLLFKSSTAALSSMMVIWVMWTVFLPKIIGDAVESLTPLPTRIEFQTAMKEDRSQGIDGHNPSGERRKALEKATLAEYGVNSIKELPINFSGILMQADEEYGNMVWDKHFGGLHQQLTEQKMNYQSSGLFNPFASLQSLSMGAAGSDMYHHLDFLKQAEIYRRVFIKTLNDKYAFGGSKTADTAFFQSVEDFAYRSPRFDSMYKRYRIDAVCLLLWFFLSVAFLRQTSKRVSVA